jgi:beta-galactosidase
MKSLRLVSIIFYFSTFLPSYSQESGIESSFNSDWKFMKGDINGAEKVKFNDKNWRAIDLPHDWSIEDLEKQEAGKTIGPFSKESQGATSTVFFMGGTGWYRKIFILPKETNGMKTILNFAGVYMDCYIWVNGKLVSNHPYGYTPFNIVITGYLNPAGQQNTIAVKVQNEGKNSRWYSISGIYRHVSIVTTNALHIAPWGVYITTSEISHKKAKVKLTIQIQNEGAGRNEIKVLTRIIRPDGKISVVNESETI